MGLFTGWEDANLAHDGREEALHAGRVLHQYDIKVMFEFRKLLTSKFIVYM